MRPFAPLYRSMKADEIHQTEAEETGFLATKSRSSTTEKKTDFAGSRLNRLRLVHALRSFDESPISTGSPPTTASASVWLDRISD